MKNNDLTISELEDKYWFKDSILHREDGPAIEFSNGNKFWYKNGYLHREDGPAVEYVDGFKSWFLHGVSVNCSSNEEFLRLMKLKGFW